MQTFWTLIFLFICIVQVLSVSVSTTYCPATGGQGCAAANRYDVATTLTAVDEEVAVVDYEITQDAETAGNVATDLQNKITIGNVVVNGKCMTSCSWFGTSTTHSVYCQNCTRQYILYEPIRNKLTQELECYDLPRDISTGKISLKTVNDIKNSCASPKLGGCNCIQGNILDPKETILLRQHLTSVIRAVRRVFNAFVAKRRRIFKRLFNRFKKYANSKIVLPRSMRTKLGSASLKCVQRFLAVNRKSRFMWKNLRVKVYDYLNTQRERVVQIIHENANQRDSNQKLFKTLQGTIIDVRKRSRDFWKSNLRNIIFPKAKCLVLLEKYRLFRPISNKMAFLKTKDFAKQLNLYRKRMRIRQ